MILKELPDGDGEVEIGWQLYPDHWGRGFASEAAGAVTSRRYHGPHLMFWAGSTPDRKPSVGPAEPCDARPTAGARSTSGPPAALSLRSGQPVEDDHRLGVEAHVGGRQVLVEVGDAPGARDEEHVGRVREQPRQPDLGGRR